MIKGDYVRKVNKHCPLDGVQVSLSFIQENRSSAKKATEKMYICTTVLLTIPWSYGSGAGSPSVSGLRVVTMSSSCLYSWPCASWRRALGPAFPLSPFTVYSVVIGLLGIAHVDTVTSNTPLKVGVGSAISILYPTRELPGDALVLVHRWTWNRAQFYRHVLSFQLRYLVRGLDRSCGS